MARKSRLLIAVMCALLLGAHPIGAADAQRSRGKRVETQSFTGPSPTISTNVSGFYASGCTSTGTSTGLTCLRFDLKRSDRFISLEIQDDTGNPVYGIVWDDDDEWLASFCGQQKKPIASPGGDFIYVEVVAANTSEGCYPSTVTEGTVTATFTRKKR
jgi:hypothetical protein